MKKVAKILNKVIATRCTNGRIKTSQVPCMTIVGLVDEENPSKISIGISVCDEQDEFNENLGHEIALGRAVKAYNDGHGRLFKRPDVMTDFAFCGLNTTGVRKLPKSIFFHNGHYAKEHGRLKVLASKPSVVKLLGLDKTV